MPAIPAGFKLLELRDGVMDGFSPVYIRFDAAGGIAIGLHIDAQHCNGRGSCHGGTWATLADVLMGLSVGAATGLSGPTVSMSLQYLAPATQGQWVEGRARVLRSTSALAFVECTFTADEAPALHANAIFRRKSPPHEVLRPLTAGALDTATSS
jgi:uncharacterized protein (TIGR00369 family)